MVPKLKEIVFMLATSLRLWKLRSGCSTSRSIRSASCRWELAIVSVPSRIRDHGPLKTLIGLVVSKTELGSTYVEPAGFVSVLISFSLEVLPVGWG